MTNDHPSTNLIFWSLGVSPRPRSASTADKLNGMLVFV
jgi:hypothetical protein